jgi:hypothetical protein
MRDIIGRCLSWLRLMIILLFVFVSGCDCNNNDTGEGNGVDQQKTQNGSIKLKSPND